MRLGIASLLLCGGVAALTTACATKGFVREQVGSTETRIGQRVETQETQLRETSQRTTAAIDSTNQRIQSVDTRATEIANVAVDAQREAVQAKQDAAEAKQSAVAVADKLGETESRFSQRFAIRNVYSTLDTKSIYFDFGKAGLRDEGVNELDEIARGLKADPNAVVELLGFADPRGTDRYNYQLSRERVDAVIRHLVQRHGIDVRRIHAVGMGKVSEMTGAKASKDALAKSRRVDIRLLAPQS
jgi:outer membrane protein OmpA-like peptidoglycan-associated protein